MTTESEEDEIITPKSLEGIIDFCLSGTDTESLKETEGQAGNTDQVMEGANEEVSIDEKKPKAAPLPDNQSKKTNEKHAEQPDLKASCSESIVQKNKNSEVRNDIEEETFDKNKFLGDEDTYGHFVDPDQEYLPRESFHSYRILGDEQFHGLNPFEDMEMPIINGQPKDNQSTKKLRLEVESQSLYPLEELSSFWGASLGEVSEDNSKNLSGLKYPAQDNSDNKTAEIISPDPAYIEQLLKDFGPTNDERAANARRSDNYRLNKKKQQIIPLTSEENEHCRTYSEKLKNLKKLNLNPSVRDLVYKELGKQVSERRKRKNSKNGLNVFLKVQLPKKARRGEDRGSNHYNDRKPTAKKRRTILKK